MNEMKRSRHIVFDCITTLMLLFAITASANDEKWGVTLGISPLIVPDYEGASDYRVIPVPLIDIDYEDTYFFSPYNGLGANLVNTPRWKIGPAITYRLWQDEDDNPALKGIGDIPGTVEIGGFIEYTAEYYRIGADIRQGVNGHRGAIANFSTELIGSIGPRIRYSIGPAIAWISKNYIDTYFGIDHKQSIRSGYDTYYPNAGFKDVGIGGSIFYALNEHWTIGAFGQYARLISETADSPIVKEAGSPNQVSMAFTLGYSF